METSPKTIVESVSTALLEDVVARGIDPKRKMLFAAVDGSKALRGAINPVFGAHQSVQRCRAHKLRNAGAPTDRSSSVGWTYSTTCPNQRRSAASQKHAPGSLETPAIAWVYLAY